MDSYQRTSVTDRVIEQLAEYVVKPPHFSEEAFSTAFCCLFDSIGCAILALNYPECRKLLGPVVPGTIVPNGSHVLGTNYVLDPILAAFNIGTMIRWLDYNDTWLAAEWGHPSDNLGALLALSDYLCRNGSPVTVGRLLQSMIMAYEIQGVLALENSFNRVGLDHVILVKVASAAVSAALLGGSHKQVENAISNAFVDAGPLRTYRHAPNTGSRKSWAAGDATSRGLFFAWLSLKNEMGYPSVLTTPRWGLEDIILRGHPLTLGRPLGCYVMENILFKVKYPAEFHAQTAVEAAIALHPLVQNRIDEIKEVSIETQKPALEIIDKQGPLHNAAARDHCMQYMVAVALLRGDLQAEDYLDDASIKEDADRLREKIILKECSQYSRDYLDPLKRSIANTVTIYMVSGEQVGPIEVEYPIGHKRRRQEAMPLLLEKFRRNTSWTFEHNVQEIMDDSVADFLESCKITLK